MAALRNLRTEPIDTRHTEITGLLDRSIPDEDGSLLALRFETLDDDFARSRNHRWMAKSTQAHQDKTLSEYRQWISGYLALRNEDIVMPDE